MSAQNTHFHIYNRGIENRLIFNQKKDYEVFLDFLKEYLTPRADRNSAKKEFTVKGRVFQGLPHQPKNYYSKVELVAYSLAPDHFHLLLRQIAAGSIERFIRSLCTRYSIYFNKKYERAGSLFQGPYKSAQVKDTSSLALLTRYFHTEHEGEYSSHAEYADKRVTSWVKPDVVVSFTGTTGYTNFVRKYQLSQQEKQALERITIERITPPLVRSVPIKNLTSSFSKKDKEFEYVTHSQRYPELFAISAVFALLVGFSIRNINAAIPQANAVPTPQVSGDSSILPQTPETIQNEEITPTIEPRPMLAVKINDGSESVNIRQEPTVQSEKIGQASEGDTFEEFVSIDSEWYEIKLEDGSTGYISATYIEILEQTNQ